MPPARGRAQIQSRYAPSLAPHCRAPRPQDTSDVRSVFDAARDGARRARDAGAKSIALALGAAFGELGGDFADALHVAVSGVLYGLYAPIQERDHAGDAAEPVTRVGVFTASAAEDSVADAIRRAVAVDAGRRLACDLVRRLRTLSPRAARVVSPSRCAPLQGGADPERMAPIPFAEEVCRALKDVHRVYVEVVSDLDTLQRVRLRCPRRRRRV